jgi:hypothetical protein
MFVYDGARGVNRPLDRVVERTTRAGLTGPVAEHGDSLASLRPRVSHLLGHPRS